MYRRFNASASDESLDSAGPRAARQAPDRARRPRAARAWSSASGDHIELWNPDRWAEHYAELDRAGRRARRGAVEASAERDGHTDLHAHRARPSPRPGADRAHSTPRPGDVVVDCTFGGGGHARLAAERIGPDRDPDRDRPRPGRGRALRRARAGAAGCLDRFEPRRLRRRARAPRGRGDARRRGADGPRDLLAAARHLGARLLLLLRRAARHAHGPGAAAERARGRQRVAGEAARGDDPRVRRGAPRALDRRRDRPPPARWRRPASWSRRSAPRSRPPTGSAAATPPSAPSRRSGSPSTASSSRSTAASRPAWDAAPRRRPAGRDLLPLARGPAGSSASSPSSPAAASARPSCRSASAATSPRRSCSRAAPSSPPRTRSSAIRARARRGCAWRASSPTQEVPA